jgi:hypothetical protein
MDAGVVSHEACGYSDDDREVAKASGFASFAYVQGGEEGRRDSRVCVWQVQVVACSDPNRTRDIGQE